MQAEMKVKDYVTSSVQSFLGDPPDTDFQEALGLRLDIAPFAKAQELLKWDEDDTAEKP